MHGIKKVHIVQHGNMPAIPLKRICREKGIVHANPSLLHSA